MKRKRIAELDILRVISLFMICIYHWFYYKGTYIGVVVFFALSGYLFTEGLLSKEFSVWSTIKKRMSKIYPSLLAVVLASTVILYFLNQGLEVKYKLSALSSILGLNNIYQIMSKMSYFDNYGVLLPLTHIWALSFQMQMYVALPLIVKGLKKINLKNRTIGIIFLLISIVSAFWMGYKFYMKADFSRIYYGTDTRAFAFFAAAAAACFYNGRQIEKKWEKRTIYILGISGFLLLAVFSVTVDYKNEYNYYGLMYLVSILTAFTIILFSKGLLKLFTFPFLKFLEKPVIKLGEHQYQYYLWQYPVMIFSRELFKWSKLSYAQQFIFQIIILIVISEICYYLFEKREISPLNYIILGLTGGFLIASPIYVNKDLKKKKKIQEEIAKGTGQPSKEKIGEEKAVSPEEGTEKKASGAAVPQTGSKNLSPEEDLKYQEELLASLPADERDILFIGDSVMEMGKIDLKKKYPNGVIETKVGRQFHELPDLLSYYSKTGKLRKIIVIGLGSNGTIYAKDMEKVIKILEGHKIYFVNTIVPDPWEESVNREIKNVAASRPDIGIIDWYSYAKGKKEYFYKDGTHPRPHASKRYVNLIYSEVSNKK